MVQAGASSSDVVARQGLQVALEAPARGNCVDQALHQRSAVIFVRLVILQQLLAPRNGAVVQGPLGAVVLLQHVHPVPPVATSPLPLRGPLEVPSFAVETRLAFPMSEGALTPPLLQVSTLGIGQTPIHGRDQPEVANVWVIRHEASPRAPAASFTARSAPAPQVMVSAARRVAVVTSMIWKQYWFQACGMLPVQPQHLHRRDNIDFGGNGLVAEPHEHPAHCNVLGFQCRRVEKSHYHSDAKIDQR
eukprot:9474651-Pyramimonas_sp.AAC.1